MRKKISQRDAHAALKRVTELERQQQHQQMSWVNDYPGGTNICSVTAPDTTIATIKTARMLRHAVVVTQRGNELMFYALPVAPK